MASAAASTAWATDGGRVDLAAIEPVPIGETVLGVPDEYATIQEAVNAAGPGDTIEVEAGTYTELVTVPAGKDGLVLLGPNAELPAGCSAADRVDEAVLTGGFVLVSANVTIQGFTIEDGAEHNAKTAAIHGYSAGNRIINNILVTGAPNDTIGLLAADGVGLDFFVRDNRFEGWGTGVLLEPSSGHHLLGNYITGCTVGLDGSAQSDLFVQGNTFNGNGGRCGGHEHWCRL